MNESTSLDLKAIVFPSDDLTISRIRVAEPTLFADRNPLHLDRGFGRSEFSALLLRERQVAIAAYGRSIGLPQESGGLDRDELVELVHEGYEKFGLSRGSHETEELVRKIERQATAQAERGRGESR